MILQELFNKLKPKNISNQLDIPYTTLIKWFKYERIDKHIKFLEFIIYLNKEHNLNIEEFIKEYKNNEHNF